MPFWFRNSTYFSSVSLVSDEDKNANPPFPSFLITSILFSHTFSGFSYTSSIFLRVKDGLPTSKPSSSLNRFTLFDLGFEVAEETIRTPFLFSAIFWIFACQCWNNSKSSSVGCPFLNRFCLNVMNFNV